MCSFVHHAKSVSRSNGIESSKNVRKKQVIYVFRKQLNHGEKKPI